MSHRLPVVLPWKLIKGCSRLRVSCPRTRQMPKIQRCQRFQAFSLDTETQRPGMTEVTIVLRGRDPYTSGRMIPMNLMAMVMESAASECGHALAGLRYLT